MTMELVCLSRKRKVVIMTAWNDSVRNSKKKLRKISESKYTGTREGVEDTVSPRNYCGKYSALFLVCVPDIFYMKKKLGTRKYLKNMPIGQTLMENNNIWFENTCA